MIVTGLIVPEIIDAVETAKQLDIKRDIGVLPWMVMTIIGIGVLIGSLIRYIKDKKIRKVESTSVEKKV